MATANVVMIETKQAEASQTTQYSCPPNTVAVVDKFTVTNTAATSLTISVNLVPLGDAAGVANLVVDARTIRPGDTYSCTELVGQTLGPGMFISTVASAATSLVLSASGREIS